MLYTLCLLNPIQNGSHDLLYSFTQCLLCCNLLWHSTMVIAFIGYWHLWFS